MKAISKLYIKAFRDDGELVLPPKHKVLGFEIREVTVYSIDSDAYKVPGGHCSKIIVLVAKPDE